MAELVFAVEMKGTLAPVEGKDGSFTFRASGTGPNGEQVTNESDVMMLEQGFKETGTLEYAGRGKVFFETVGVGDIGPSPVPDLSAGAVLWRITGGEGEFKGASGYITSNFTCTAAGEAVDNNYVRMFLP